jgi:hypothetical protein
MARQPAGRGLERHPRPYAGEEVHGPEVGGGQDLEGDPKPGRRRRGGRAESAKEADTASALAPKAARKAKHSAKQPRKAKAASTRKSAAKAPAKAANSRPGKPASPAAARDGSKKAEILGMLQRKGGATLAQIMKLPAGRRTRYAGSSPARWARKMGLTVGSVRREDGERVYTLVS